MIIGQDVIQKSTAHKSIDLHDEVAGDYWQQATLSLQPLLHNV